MSRMLDSEADKFFGRKAPPVDDSWRPKPTRGHKKPLGLTVWKAGWRGRILEWTQWYSSERDRQNAINCANKQLEKNGFYLPVVAMAKVSR